MQNSNHTVPNVTLRNICSEHPVASLVHITDCDVEFVYTIGRLLRQHQVEPSENFHNHKAIATHRIPRKVCKDIATAVETIPSLTASQLACGQGLRYCPAAADLSAAHQGRLSSIKKKDKL